MNKLGLNQPPTVTVLLPVYNGAAFLRDAVDSILAQTYTDFELLIIDDGSTDESLSIAESFQDDRIRIHTHAVNLGLVTTLNEGIELSRGQLIARMDGDDLSCPGRLASQVGFMAENSEIAVCGSWVYAFDAKQKTAWQAPTSHEEIMCDLLFQPAIYHPSAMLRKPLLDRHRLRYNPDYQFAQDYELWVRAGRACRLANVDKYLLYYRLHDKSIGKENTQAQMQMANKVRATYLDWIGISANEEELTIHEQVSFWRPPADYDGLIKIHEWLLRLLKESQPRQIFSEDLLAKKLGERWFYLCANSVKYGRKVHALWAESPLSGCYKPEFLRRMKFALQCQAYDLGDAGNMKQIFKCKER